MTKNKLTEGVAAGEGETQERQPYGTGASHWCGSSKRKNIDCNGARQQRLAAPINREQRLPERGRHTRGRS